MANSALSLPTSGGGLMRYSEEYKSKFILKPTHIIIFVVLIVAFVTALKLLYPIK